LRISTRLTTVRDAAAVRALTYEAAAAWLALGLESSGAMLYRQSGDARERYSALLDDPAHIDAVLTVGADAARQAAAPGLQLVRRAVGVAPLQ
jgi:hypothetical protein